MAYDYTTYTNTLASMLSYATTDADFVLLEPRAIEYAENRMYRDFDFLYQVKTASAALTANIRTLTVPGDIDIVQSANVITPVGTAADAGTRNPLQRTTPEFINYAWPNSTSGGLPIQYAMLDQTTALFGPVPDDAYNVEFMGTYQPAPLSVTNTSTFLTTDLPDVFLAASMIFGSGFQKNYGSQSDDPQSAMSWEQTYQNLKESAQVNEARKKAQSQGWTAYTPTPYVAPTPPRT